MNELGIRPRRQFVGAPSQRVLPRRVYPDEASTHVRNAQHVRGEREEMVERRRPPVDLFFERALRLRHLLRHRGKRHAEPSDLVAAIGSHIFPVLASRNRFRRACQIVQRLRDAGAHDRDERRRDEDEPDGEQTEPGENGTRREQNHTARKIHPDGPRRAVNEREAAEPLGAVAGKARRNSRPRDVHRHGNDLAGEIGPEISGAIAYDERGAGADETADHIGVGGAPQDAPNDEKSRASALERPVVA